jgi:hypothetical protein
MGGHALKQHIHVHKEGAGNIHIAERYTYVSLHNEFARCNVGVHDRRARISVRKACMMRMYIHVNEEDARNVHIAKR